MRGASPPLLGPGYRCRFVPEGERKPWSVGRRVRPTDQADDSAAGRGRHSITRGGFLQAQELEVALILVENIVDQL